MVNIRKRNLQICLLDVHPVGNDNSLNSAARKKTVCTIKQKDLKMRKPKGNMMSNLEQKAIKAQKDTKCC